MNRAMLVRRLDQLERLLVPPPSFAARVLRTATDAQLDEVEVELERGVSSALDALVDAYTSEEPGS